MLADVESGWSALKKGCSNNRKNWQNLVDAPAESDVTSSPRVTSPATRDVTTQKTQPRVTNLNNEERRRSGSESPLRKVSNNSVKNLSQNNLQKQNNHDLDKLRKISNQSIRNDTTHSGLVINAHLPSGKKRDVIAPPSPTQMTQLRDVAQSRKTQSSTCVIL